MHVIGAGLAEATGASQKFFEISNLIPNIEKLHLVLIGPYLKGMTTGGGAHQGREVGDIALRGLVHL